MDREDHSGTGTFQGVKWAEEFDDQLEEIVTSWDGNTAGHG